MGTRSRLMVLAVSVGVLAGCSATRESASVQQLQLRVERMEQELIQRDREIEGLKFEVNRLTAKPGIPRGSSTASGLRGGATGVSKMPKEILRVPVSAQDVQTALQKAGYYQGTIDGKLGPKSVESIKSFQRDHNLKVDGIIGQGTWSQMKGYLEPAAIPAAEPAVESAPAGEIAP